MASNIQEALKIIAEEQEKQKLEMYSKGFSTNRIIFGDCLEHMSKIPTGMIDLCITDPPWGINFDTFREKFKDVKIANDLYKDFLHLMETFPYELNRILKDNGVAYVFCGGTTVFRGEILNWVPATTIKLFLSAGFSPQRMIIWNKMSPGRMYKYRAKTEFVIYFVKKKTPVWNGCGEFKDDLIELEEEMVNIPKVHGSKKVHPTQKPDRIYESFINDSSNPGDLILDPFAGSGVIVSACKNTGRNYLAIEKEECYHEFIESREKQITLLETISKVKQVNIYGGQESVVPGFEVEKEKHDYSFMEDDDEQGENK